MQVIILHSELRKRVLNLLTDTHVFWLNLSQIIKIEYYDRQFIMPVKFQFT